MNNDANSTSPPDDGSTKRNRGRVSQGRGTGREATRRHGSASDAGDRDCPHDEAPRAPFRVTIHPFHGPAEGVDVTDALVDAIAHVLWKLHGGNEPVNRVEAIVLLERAMKR